MTDDGGGRVGGTTPRARVREDPEVRKRRILDASARLFATQGFADTTVRHIADAVEVLSGSLYHYFASKEAILEAVVREFMLDLVHGTEQIAHGPGTPRERVAGLVRHAFAQIDERPFHVMTYQAEFLRLQDQSEFAFVTDLSARIEGLWIETLAASAADFPVEMDVHVRYRLVRDAVWGAVRWYRPRHGSTADLPAPDLAAEYLATFYGSRT